MTVAAERPLVPLPPQPEGVPWPTGAWPVGPVPAGVALEALLDTAFTDPAMATTYAVVVVHGGRLVAERYGGELEHWDRPAEPVGPGTGLLSWSMAKSVLHACVGLLVGEGRLRVEAPAAVTAWQEDGDPRREVALEDLLAMRDGLAWAEDYVDAGVSDVIEMLFGAGQHDVAAFAADRPLAARPGERFNYSSGTSNIVSALVADVVGRGDAYEDFLRDRLFTPIGMTSARPRLDATGTWVASSYLYATAQDWARFGMLYLRDGTWEGRRLLPEGWVDHGRRFRSVDADTGDRYGAHWWLEHDDLGTFTARGYEGQSIAICPALDLVVARLGRTPEERKEPVAQWRTDVVAAFAAATS